MIEEKAGANQVVRVGFLVSTLATGGAERQLEHIIRHLDRARFEPRIYTLKEPGPIGEALRAAGIALVPGLQPGRLPSPASPLALARRFRRDGIRCLYCLDHTNAIVAGAIAARIAGGLPLLVAIHTMGQWDRPSLPRPVRMVLGAITRIVAIAEAQKRYLVGKEGVPPSRIVVIPNGIPVPDLAALPSKSAARAALDIASGDDPVIGIVAMLRPEKAHENFLAAARLVLAEHPTGLFLVVGDGPRRAELEALAHELGIGPRVRFLGRRDDVPRVLRAMDLSVLASHPRVETLPLSQMEAMACEVPVLATRVGALEELVTDGVEGRLVPPGDATALAGAMNAMLADREALAAAGRAARARVQAGFTVERTVAETGRLIASLV